MPAYAKQDTKSQKLKAKQWSRKKKMAQNLKSVYYYCRGPSFSFQHPHSSSHPQLQFLGAITLSSGLHRHCTYLYMVDKNLKQTDRQTDIYIYIVVWVYPSSVLFSWYQENRSEEGEINPHNYGLLISEKGYSPFNYQHHQNLVTTCKIMKLVFISQLA